MKDIFKKIIVLTYITFILISFFTPFNLSFAQDESGQCTPPKKLIGGYCVDPLGTCTYSDGTKTSPIVRSVCENKEGRMGLDGKIKQGTWDESGQCTPPKKLIGGYCVDPLGTCTYSDGTKTYPIVRSVCENKEGRMVLDGKIKQGTWAEAPSTSSQENTYSQLLEPLPGLGNEEGKVDTASPDAFGKYINAIIILFIGICAVLAVVMIVIGGIEYSTSELISSKEAAKERIRGALLGLLLALGAFLLLKTINPDLLNLDVAIDPVTLNVTVQEFILSPSTYIVPLGKTGRWSGTTCDENEIAAAAYLAGHTLTNAQIHTLACIGGIESGCKSVQNREKWGKGSSAYGPFQILLQRNSRCFENNICYQAAGVSGPLNCDTGFRGGNPIPGSPIVQQCKRAADNFNCSVSAAICLIIDRPDFGDWNANPNLSKCK